MDEYINRKLITDSLEEIYNDIPVWEDDDDWNRGIKEGIWVAMSCINALPSAQPERIRGRWIKDEEASNQHVEPIYICSACNNMDAWGEVEKNTFKFCPNCGAEMRDTQDA